MPASACKREGPASTSGVVGDVIPGQPAASANTADVRVLMPEAPDAGRAPGIPPLPSDASAAVAPDSAAVSDNPDSGLPGGTGEGTIGISVIGPIGTSGIGPIGDNRYGTGVSRMVRRVGRGPTVGVLPATVQGGISIAAVRRVVLRALPQIQFCYEQGLMRNPNLGGRVVVRFAVSSSGSVATSAIAESNLTNPLVESCIANAVRRWLFPSPAGGGIAIVSLPFTFRPE